MSEGALGERVGSCEVGVRVFNRRTAKAGEVRGNVLAVYNCSDALTDLTNVSRKRRV